LIYHGNGGFNFSDVYNMPIWARKFYINRIIEFKDEQNKQFDKQKQTVERPNIKYPT
jgi:hypothetical protein